MNNLILLPTAKLKGVGVLGEVVKGFLFRPGMTSVQRMEVEKRIARGTRLPVANDSLFAPGAA